MRYGAIMRVSKNASMVLLGTVIRMALTFAFSVYVARSFGVEQYGKYALAFGLFDMFLSLSATGLCILVTRETAKDHAWLGRNLGAAVRIVSALGMTAAAVLLIVSQVVGYAPDTRAALCIAAAALLPGSISTLAEAVFVAWEKAEFVAIGTVVESIVRIVLSFAALWSGYGLLSLFIVLIGTRVLQLLIYSIVILRRQPVATWQAETGAAAALMKQWRVFAAENWLSVLSSGTDVFLLSLFWGEAAVGIYDAAWKLIRLSAVVARSFTTAVFPYISRLYVRAEETFHQVNIHSVKYMLALLLPAVLTLSVLSDRIVQLLYGAQYASSAPVLQVLAWLMIPQFLNPFLSHILFARHEQHRSLIVASINVTTFFIAAFALIPIWGPVGAAASVLTSAFTAFCCYLAFCVWGWNARNLTLILLRQTVAAGVLFAFLYSTRGEDLAHVFVFGVAIYAAMLVALRIVTWSDFKLLQELH